MENRLLKLLTISIILLSSFLIFTSELIISRILLPYFGGTPSLWIISMMFFTATLFSGYLYAHFLTNKLNIKTGLIVHTIFLFLLLFKTSIIPDKTIINTQIKNIEPTLNILNILLRTTGFQFFCLSSTLILIQWWIGRILNLKLSYGLYSFSNFSSIVALLLYPTLFETMWGLKIQTKIWSNIFLFYILLFIILIIKLLISLKTDKKNFNNEDNSSIKLIDYTKWFSISFISVSLYLSITAKISQDISVVPLLWIAPLFVYLLSFVLSFQEKNINNHKYYIYSATISLFIVSLTMTHIFTLLKSVEIIIYVLSLFLFNMSCHGELYKLKPSSNNLSKFYLMISFGGMIGTIVIAIISPLIFNDFYELHFSLLLFTFFLLSLYVKGFNQFIKKRPIFKTVLLFFIPFLIVVLPGFYFISHLNSKKLIFSSRNFYGFQKVYEENLKNNLKIRTFFSGNTIHGFQFNDNRKNIPNAYYGLKSGLGMVIKAMQKKESLNIADIGLGVGTISAYGRKKDRILFFELNPQIKMIAEKYFTFLSSSPSKIDIIIGDGRIQLNKNREKFDLIILDAFSGDGVPIHLLTKEAFLIYKSHLKKNGVIVANISNLYIDLKPVFNFIARTFSWKHIFLRRKMDIKNGDYESEWAILTKNKDFIKNLKLYPETEKIDFNFSVKNWSDDFNSILSILR